METIGIDQSLLKRSSFEHTCLNNIQKIYQHAGKCDDQQNLKYILDDAMMSTPQGLTNDSPNLPMTSTPVKKSSARKSLCYLPTYLMLKMK